MENIHNNDVNDSVLTAFAIGSNLDDEWIWSRYLISYDPNRYWFVTYTPIDVGSILVGNNASCKIVGIDIVRIKCHD